jgi:hypothetical protein
MTQVDHYTPLSRAVASIDRDAYSARFAIYDRAHKALLRRFATGEIPCSDADVEREEHAFREAVRRIEFADEYAAEQRAAGAATAEEVAAEELAEAEPAPPLVPQRDPPEDVLQELRRDAPWPEVRIPRESVRDSFEDVDSMDAPSLEPELSDPSVGPLARLRRPSRSVTRRVGERLVLAVVVLIFGATWVLMADARRSSAEQSAPAAVETATDAAATQAAAQAGAADTRPQQPGWLSPELFYSVPPPPSARAAPPPAHRP